MKQIFIKDNNGEKGAATLLVVTVVTAIIVTISIALARSNLIQFQSVENLKNSRHVYYLSESGIEDTLLQLEENINYTGNLSGEITPIGTYYSEVDALGDDYTITSWVSENQVRREVSLNITLSYELAEVTTKATYMADFFWINGEDARIRGDVWTNDDFEIVENGVVEGNLAAGGKGSMAVNWVWDGIIGGNPTLTGGQVIDNPDTPKADGNINAADAVKVSGPTAYVEGNVTSDSYVWEIFGGTIDGDIAEYASQTWDPIPVPSFDFSEFESQAVQKGTYFSSANSFLTYLESIDDGNERRLTDDVYYIDNGALKIPAGSPVYLDGLLVVEDNLYIYSEWYQTAQGGLPAIVSGKGIEIANKFNLWSWNYDYAGPVRIEGIVFAEKDVSLFRTYSNEDIIINGAVWAGDDVFIMEHTFINYDLDPLNVNGFDFVSGISDLQKNYWREII
ncbi:MAG: polymer-forming cytoskeletal protein [Candidatus Dojkabacteria bacterium]|nr:polymer-forming cytoskeletal protein [Candidatus Dojkabacteria bacterium]